MILNLNAEPRTLNKKSDLTKIRSNGQIPGIIYGSGIDSIPITIQQAEFTRCYKKSIGELAFFEIEINNTKYHTVLKDKQIHPVTREMLHLDFMTIKPQSKVDIEVPVKFVGTPIGVKEGGVLDIEHRIVKLHCDADAIPEDLVLDISALKVGDSLHVKHLPTGKWSCKDNPETTLVVVLAPKLDKHATTEAPAATEDK